MPAITLLRGAVYNFGMKKSDMSMTIGAVSENIDLLSICYRGLFLC